MWYGISHTGCATETNLGYAEMDAVATAADKPTTTAFGNSRTVMHIDTLAQLKSASCAKDHVKNDFSDSVKLIIVQ